jgi:heat shock protein HslJ
MILVRKKGRNPMKNMRQLTKPRYLGATLLVVLLALVGCTIPQPPAGTPGATTESTALANTPAAATTPAATGGVTESDPLVNTSWQLTTFGPAGAETPVVADSTVTLEFSADGTAGGNTGCNSYGGDYTVEGDTLSFGEMVSTLMACADETVMAQEQAYLEALQSAARFEVTADQLTIWYDDGNSQLNFAPQTANTQEPPVADDTAAVVGDEMAERVEFETGTTETTLSGTIAAGSDKQYALAASVGQTVRVQTVGDGTPVDIAVYGPGGASWSGEAQAEDDATVTAEVTAPENGDYLVVLSLPADAAETSYEVTFTIDATASQPGPVERIAFAPDGNPTERRGELPDGPIVQQYLLSTNAGVTLTVDATSDEVPLSMTIESPSGNQWIPEMMPADDGYTIGREFTAPEPGYYLVTLNKDAGTPSTSFTIAFTLQS